MADPARDDAQHSRWNPRLYLPHVSLDGGPIHVVFRLADSVPADVVETWEDELANRPPADRRAYLRSRIDRYLDFGHGACVLGIPDIAQVVVDAIRFHADRRYLLHAWCVMPNHVHILLTVASGINLSAIVHSWKSFTAHQINKALRTTGNVWMPDYFDRQIRDESHFDSTLTYIHENPVRAGLVASPEEWRWSSASGTGLEATDGPRA